MLNKNEILSFLQEHIHDLKTEYKISKIGIFGSFARNEENDNSDIDILLEFESGTENIYEKKIKLKEYLSANFNRDVDLCREKYIKPYIRDYLANEVIYV
jgi:uncharacterized protein